MISVTGRSCLLLSLALVPSIALAQATPTQAAPETMRDLATIVVETNPQVVAQRAAVQALEARRGIARSGYFPTVEANGLAQRRRLDFYDGTADSTFTALQGGIEGRWRVFDGLRTPSLVKVSYAELDAGRAVLDDTISAILLDLLQTTADVRRDRQVLRYVQQQHEAIAEQLRGTSRRLSVGEATRTDQNQAEARLATSAAGILAATEELEANGSVFEAVSGRPAATAPTLPPLAQLPGSLDEALAVAQSENPRLRAAKDTARAAQSGVAVARAALSPTIDLVAGYEYLSGGVANLFTGRLPTDRSALYGGAEARLPIFFGGRNLAEIRRSRAVSDQRLSQVSDTARSVAQDVTTAWARWKAATATIAAARTAVAANEKAADGVRKEAIGGSRTVLDTLDAENELLSARVTLERALRNEYVARATVLATAGRLVPEAILTP